MMHNFIFSKKAMEADPKKAIVGVVLTIAFMVMILVVVWNITSGAEGLADEARCRLSVMHRALNPIEAIYASPLQCRTARVDLSDDATSDDKDEYTRQIAELSMDCWNMFGQGALRTLQENEGFIDAFEGWITSENFFGIHNDRAFCFVCYDFRADFPDDDMEITEPDLISYMENRIYVAEGAYIDVCDKEDEMDEEECRRLREEISRSPCAMRGGECRQQCSGDQLMQTDAGWECEDDNDSCCISRQRAFSYMDYLRYDSPTYGHFELYSEEGIFRAEEGERYGVMYLEPYDSDAGSYIAIANMDHVDGVCTIKS